MARKKKPEEHENLERWLVSYADFMTLLFATFVVLYALSQININEFKKVEESLKKAFSIQSILDGGSGVMSSGNSVMDTSAADSVIDNLLMEYISPRYEQESYEKIKKEVEDLAKSGEMDGVSATIDERGLVITITDKNILFASASAELNANAKKLLDKIGKLIIEKFAMHSIRVEGHTDSLPISGGKYPSNWELSSARASRVVRYLINSQGFNPKLFIATGLADTIPVAPNTTAQNKAKNRRVEIIILKNKNKHLSKKNMQEIIKEVQIEQKKVNMQKKQPSKAIEGLIGNDKELLQNVIDLTDQYENENKRLDSLQSGDYMHDGSKPEFMEQNNERK